MDIYKVIYLGHRANVPLIRVPSELTDGFEPHDHILQHRGQLGHSGSTGGWGGVYPGWVRQVGTWEVLYRVLSRGHI